MFISYYVYIECRERVEPYVVRTCDPTPIAVNILAINVFKL